MIRDVFSVRPIGVIRTPFVQATDTPIQPIAAEGVRGRIELDEEYVEGLMDLEGFSHITLVYLFHQIQGCALRVVPFMDTVEHGIFATRAPKRPNRIGISTVRLLGVAGNVVEVEQVDMLDGTPLLDIKPFYARYDHREGTRCGWLEGSRNVPVERLKADNRFEGP